MIDTKSFLLAGMTLAALSAHADTYAPAEERPGRTVLVPMSVERPPGESWALVRRTDVDLVFLRPAEKNRSSLVAIASSKVPDRRARSTQELAANIREELKAKADDTRFEVLSEEAMCAALRVMGLFIVLVSCERIVGTGAAQPK